MQWLNSGNPHDWFWFMILLPFANVLCNWKQTVQTTNIFIFYLPNKTKQKSKQLFGYWRKIPSKLEFQRINSSFPFPALSFTRESGLYFFFCPHKLCCDHDLLQRQDKCLYCLDRKLKAFLFSQEKCLWPWVNKGKPQGGIAGLKIICSLEWLSFQRDSQKNFRPCGGSGKSENEMITNSFLKARAKWGVIPH